jgi:hypothetical protein
LRWLLYGPHRSGFAANSFDIAYHYCPVISRTGTTGYEIG